VRYTHFLKKVDKADKLGRLDNVVPVAAADFVAKS
jgi:hypothetical protein